MIEVTRTSEDHDIMEITSFNESANIGRHLFRDYFMSNSETSQLPCHTSLKKASAVENLYSGSNLFHSSDTCSSPPWIPIVKPATSMPANWRASSGENDG